MFRWTGKKEKPKKRLDDDVRAWIFIALIDGAALIAVGCLYFWFASGNPTS